MGIDPVTHAPRLDLLDLSSVLSSPHLNLPNLLRLQTLINPEGLRLALSLVSSNVENPNILMHKLQENQLLDSHNLQNQAPLFQPNQFENVVSQQNPSNHTDSSLPNQLQNNLGQLNTSSPSSSGQAFQNYCPTNESFPNNFFHGVSDQMKGDLSENSSFDSVLSTPSASTFINGSTEDEKESFCSNLMRFEIPDSLELDYFM